VLRLTIQGKQQFFDGHYRENSNAELDTKGTAIVLSLLLLGQQLR